MLCRLLFVLRSSCLRPSPTCWLPCIFPLMQRGQLLQSQWREKNNEEEDKLVSLPPSLCRNFLPLISSFFSITKDSFHCCQLNESLCILHPIPTHYSAFSLSLAGDVSSSSFFSLCILPFKYSFCGNGVYVFLVVPAFEEGKHFRSFMSLSCGLSGLLVIVKNCV